jgi:hypothetical protein
MDEKDDKAGDSFAEHDEIPRQSLFSAIPKRTLSRVLMLLAVLAAILYLRERTSSVAACLSTAFQVPAPASRPAAGTVRARIELHSDVGGSPQ